MRPLSHIIILAIAALVLPVSANAGPDDFHAGTIITDYGQVATINMDQPLPKRLRLKVSFDAAKSGEPGKVNRNFDSLARFINMHAEAGIPIKRIKVAMVVHGGASHDLTNAAHYGDKYDGAENANAGLIKALTEVGVRFYLCGQSAAYHDIDNSDLLPGVEMSLSAMTAHALLQQDGYTLNPF